MFRNAGITFVRIPAHSAQVMKYGREGSDSVFPSSLTRPKFTAFPWPLASHHASATT